jgi:hypothetical protein
LDAYKFNLLKNKQTFISQMKNCELNVRTLDEGALDEKSGMNFSEYIAILSGDTTLLDKAKVEKKVAQLEGWKSAHYKEVARNRYSLESAQKELSAKRNTLTALTKDEAQYKKELKHSSDGTKLNPVQLKGFGDLNSEAIGNRIIELYRKWQPKKGEPEEKQIGTLYGFSLYIRQQKEGYKENDIFKYRLQNHLYAEGPGGIKYQSGGGHPNVDNPKLAARYFLNAIDKVSGLREKYAKEEAEVVKEIPILRELSQKTFEKESDLTELRVELRKLEGEIAARIRETQMKAVPMNEETEKIIAEEVKDTLDHSENLRPLRLQSIDLPGYPAEGMGR